ncbi:PRC-barrel domain-containing protein [Clostridium sp. SHJSY1]|uniref:PRC-barrel domain-containing protein n=1 Tax=Clostridium sp. SHJSY1 TaxID=2942483 RepID=UPI002876EA31|nr:PRC-barrel domain-containing protein [Clostridium sp. SHJSY1]MDS0524989.1 PRC-barrel domain-containing protein [Clostridium sp. SHJSY1]
MFRSKDLYMKNIYDFNGKKLGVSRTIYIDFYRGKVLGLGFNSYSVKGKRNFIDVKDIILIDDDILVKGATKGQGLKFSDIKDMEVIDRLGNSKGVVEDVLINEENFKIQGLIISPSIVDRMLRGKEVILIKNSVLGEDYILYLGEPNVVLKNIPHEISKNEYFKKA